jgi:hypothetical protein
MLVKPSLTPDSKGVKTKKSPTDQDENEEHFSTDDKSPSKTKSPLSVDSSNVKSKKLNKTPSYSFSNFGSGTMKLYEPASTINKSTAISRIQIKCFESPADLPNAKDSPG